MSNCSLQAFIDSFTQTELQELLNTSTVDKRSKTNLRERSHELLKRQTKETKTRIEEIVAKRSLIEIPPPVEPVPQVIATPIYSPYPQYTVVQHQLPQQKQQQHALQPQQLYQQPQSQQHNNGNTMYQPNIGMVAPTGNGAVVSHGSNGMVPPYTTAGLVANFPSHPDIKLKKLAFFDVLATLLKPSTLMPNSATQRPQEATFYFTLTPDQATHIALSRDIRNPAKVEHVFQIQLRFCLLDTTTEQDDYFPPNIAVKVNNKPCTLPNPIPTNKPGVEPKRPPRPVNITTNVKLSPTVANVLNVQWCADYTRGFVVSVYLVKKLTSAQLLQRMQTKGVQPLDHTQGIIKEKLNEDADCEIATTMLRVSLVCPLGKMRMTTPCRASTCSHLQCFDASLFLQMNERKPTWNCPVCDKPAVYETLVIDGYFQDVLSSSRLPSDINEIQLHKDGSWSIEESDNVSHSLDTSTKQIQKVEVISDDVELIITEDTPASITTDSENGNRTNSRSNEPTSTTTTTIMGDPVDLTLSDSDDDVPLRRKATNNTVQSATTRTNNTRSGTPVITNAKKKQKTR